MGSKKHKKHHKSDRKEKLPEGILTASITERPAEPLRLVLKVGGSSASEHGDSPHVQPHPEVYMEDKTFKLPEKHKKSKKKKKKKSSDREKKHKHHHHHHEKKEKRKRERSEEMARDDMEVTLEQEESQEPPAKQPMYDEEGIPERVYREPRACTLKNRQGKSPLQQLLEYLLKTLEHKDPQQFFAWPVTDHIAPGYSSIIAHPMDFSTMRTKIENNEYSNLSEFQTDLKLLCDNAMTYNRPDTVYYKSAKKMLHVGMKSTSKEKLITLRNSLPYLNELGREELGFELFEEQPQVTSADSAVVDENVPTKEIKKKKKLDQPSQPEIGDDGMTPEEILAHARRAAKAAADKLTLRRPNSKFGFLRQHNDGSTSLAILNPGGGKEGIKEERKVTLEMLVGKLQQGTNSIAGFKEDKRNIVKPVKYLNYGNYSSYAPSYDSTFSNLTKEESDLLYSTYGDETGVQYAESLLNFVRDCDFAMEMADNLLNFLTDGEHSKTMKTVEARKKRQDIEMKKAEEKRSKNKKEEAKIAFNPSLDFDYAALKSLSDEGIDMSFLDSMEKQISRDPIQKKLDETTNLLQDLAKVQNARLSAKPPLHLGHTPGPSNEELQLAAKVTESLTELSKKVVPADIVDVSGIRKAMGITTNSTFDDKDDAGIIDIQAIASPAVTVPGNGGEHSPVDHCGGVVVSGEEGVVVPIADAITQAVKEATSDSLSTGMDLEASNVVDQALTDTDLVNVDEPTLNTDDQVEDFEVELREFLETGPSLRGPDSPTHVDVSLDDVIP